MNAVEPTLLQITLVESVHLRNPNAEIRIPVALALMSKYPFFDAFDSILRQMARVVLGKYEEHESYGGKEKDTNSGALGTLETMVVRLIDEIPAPLRGNGTIEFSLYPGTSKIRVCQSAVNALPICDASMSSLFDVLKVDEVCTLWWALLQEEKVLVLCEDRSKLGELCAAMMALLYPLKWCFARLDLVPSYPKTMANVIFSPTPGIFGMRKSQLPAGFVLGSDDGPIVVDVGAKRLRTNKYLDAAPMPTWLRSQLLQRLQRANFIVHKNEELTRHRKSMSVRRAFFSALTTLLKASSDFVLPSWNGRGEWTESPDLDGFRLHLEKSLDFHSESAQNFCSTQMINQYFELIIRSPLDEPIWDVLLITSRTKHMMPPFDCAHGRFFEDSSLEESAKLEYQIDLPARRETEPQRSRNSYSNDGDAKNGSHSMTCAEVLKLLRLDRLPVPNPTDAPWGTSSAESNGVIESRDVSHRKRGGAVSNDRTIRKEKAFSKLLKRVQPWMYTSGDIIDKRCRYAEAVNEQGVVGCSVLHDDLLTKTSNALLKFAESMRSIRLAEHPYRCIGTDGDVSPLLQDYVWAPIDIYVNSWGLAFATAAKQLKKYQGKILDLQRRLQNHNRLLEHFEQRTRVRLFKMKGSSEKARREHHELQDQLQGAIEAASSRSEESLKEFSRLRNKIFSSAVRENRWSAALFYELPRCPEAMDYILMRLKVLEQERCQVTANNLRWIVNSLSSLLSTLELKLSQTLGLSCSYDIEAKGTRQKVMVPKDTIAGMNIEAKIDWPASISTKKVFNVTCPKEFDEASRTFDAMFRHPLFLAKSTVEEGDTVGRWKELCNQSRQLQRVSTRIGKWSSSVDIATNQVCQSLKSILTRVHDQLGKCLLGKGDKLIEQIKRVANKCIKPLAAMSRNVAIDFRDCIYADFKTSVRAIVAKQNTLNIAVERSGISLRTAKNAHRKLESTLIGKKKTYTARTAVKDSADQAVAKDVHYPTIRLSLSRDQWLGLKTKKGSSTFSFESNNLVVSGVHHAHRHYFESVGLRTKHMLLTLNNQPVIGHKYANICRLVEQSFTKGSKTADFTFGSKKCGAQYTADLSSLRARKEVEDCAAKSKMSAAILSKAQNEYDALITRAIDEITRDMKNHVKSMHASCKVFQKKQYEMIRQLNKKPSDRMLDVVKEIKNLDTDSLYEDYLRTIEDIKFNGECHMKRYAPFLIQNHLPFTKGKKDELWLVPEIEEKSEVRTMMRNFDRSRFGEAAVVDILEKTATVFKSFGAGCHSLCRANESYASELTNLSRSIKMPKHSPQNHHAKWLGKVQEVIRKSALDAAASSTIQAIDHFRRASLDLRFCFFYEMVADDSGTVGTIQNEFREIASGFKEQQDKSDASLKKMQNALSRAIELESEMSELGSIPVQSSGDGYTWYGAKKLPSMTDVVATAKSTKDEAEVQFQLESDMLVTSSAIRNLSQDLLYARIEFELERWLSGLMSPLRSVITALKASPLEVSQMSKLGRVIKLGVHQTTKLCENMKTQIKNGDETFFNEGDDWGFDTLEDFMYVWEYMILAFIKLFDGLESVSKDLLRAWPTAAVSIPRLWFEETELHATLEALNRLVGKVRDCYENDVRLVSKIVAALHKLLIDIRWTKHALIEKKERVVMLSSSVRSSREVTSEAYKCLEITNTWCEKVAETFGAAVDELVCHRRDQTNPSIETCAESLQKKMSSVSVNKAIQQFIHHYDKNSL
eukprot:g4360.t1